MPWISFRHAGMVWNTTATNMLLVRAFSCKFQKRTCSESYFVLRNEVCLEGRFKFAVAQVGVGCL